MEKVILTANLRKNITKSSRSDLRRNGRIPGVYYSKHGSPIPIDVNEKAINPLVYTTETHLISLQLNANEEYDCVIKDIQFDPITDKVIHIDLLGLTSGETFQLEVPIQFHGNPVGVKEGGVLQTLLHKLDIECLPKDIPQHIDINIQDLKLGDSIHVKDLVIENVEILNPADTVIAAVTHPKAEIEVSAEAAVEGPTEPEVIGKAKAEDEEE
ncbi:MAG: 50S ribosomal protein L25 [Bacteroidetes bacterium]|nr:50S ribosomal protein L25 [Bacteroidota bacterium]